MNPSVLHLVISLAPGGLERLVVDWTNARNRRLPGSTWIVCLDELGAMAGQVENGEVMCVQAKRNRFPWDHAAVRRIVNLFRTPHSALPASPVLHAHNLAAWQYAVLTKIYWKRMRTLNIEHSTLNVERGGAKAPDRSQLDVECSMFNVQRSNSLPPLRLIYTQHGANVHNMRLRDRIRARLLACFTDEIVAVSEATAAVMAKTMWLSRHRIKVIANGVAVGKPSTQCEAPVVTAVSAVQSPVGREDAAGTAATTEERLLRSKDTLSGRGKIGIPADAFVMGSVGRLAHVKGQDRLIAAFAELGRSQTTDSTEEKKFEQKPAKAAKGEILFPAGGGEENSSSRASRASVQISSAAWFEYFLLFVGDGPERANLERQAMDLGIADRVIFGGYQADPAPYLAAMDLFVLPSRSEGVSVALLEAMANGVPVAVTDVGANREVVDDGRCGVILPEDETQWPEAITALITDTEAATQRTQAAQQRVRACYSLDATLDGYERLYGGGVHMTSVGDENSS